MTNTKIEFFISDKTDHCVTSEFYIDDRLRFSRLNKEKIVILELCNDELDTQSHCLKIVVKGKRQIIDHSNDSTAALEINKLLFNGIDVLPMIQGTFTHDFNGFGESTTEDFCTILGCDGTLQFTFYTPLSYWIAKQYPY